MSSWAVRPLSARATLMRKTGLGGRCASCWPVLLFYWLASRGDDQPNYATAPVQRGDLRVTVSATGNLQPTNKVDVGSELSGLITEVNVDNNDAVRKGDVLARLDTSRLQDAIAQSRAALQSAQAGVAQAQATAQQTQAALARLEEVQATLGRQGALGRRVR